MRGNNVLGIVFSNMHDEYLKELTAVRTLGSIPFGGRYRLIDFALSNMVNSGITKVGVITKSNYQSLMDHLGSGKAWNLSRKRQGLYILPPFGQGNDIYNDRIQALEGIMPFLNHSNEEYVLLSDCDLVLNFDIDAMMEAHMASGADITIAYKYGIKPERRNDVIVMDLDETDRVTNIEIDPQRTQACCFGLNIYLMRRDFLKMAISSARSKSATSFVRDVVQSRVLKNRIYGYSVKEHASIIDSVASYFSANMDLLKPEVRAELFERSRPIYTKVRDDMPTRYGLGSSVKNSLIADGCVIEGEVENSILFRGVHVGKGCKVKNCIIGQNSVLGVNSQLAYVITDKDVVLKGGRTLMGFETYPVFIGKEAVV